jgi:cell division protein FtsB
MMRLITLVLVALVVLIQYPLWFGKGGWLRVHEMQREVQLQNDINQQTRERNDKLAAEVRDLKEGAGAVEERARYELGMIKDGEVFVQIVDPPHPDGNKDAASSGPPAASADESAVKPQPIQSNTAATTQGPTAHSTAASSTEPARSAR